MEKRKPGRPRKTENVGYIVTLRANNTDYTGTGATLDAALLAIPEFNPKTKGFISVTKDNKTSKETVLLIRQMNRLRHPGLTGVIQRAMLVKRFSIL